MRMEIGIRENCENLLDSIGDEEITRYCYKHNLITKKQALKIIGDPDNLEKHKYFCYIYVDTDDVLDEIGNDKLYEWLTDNGYDFPENYDSESSELTKEEWIKGIRNYFSQNFIRVFTKEDFKKEICKAIDDFDYGI